jgi:signal transduction histidine kinase/streptogramin lyase
MNPGKQYIIPLFILIGCLGLINSYAQQPYREFRSNKYRPINWTSDDGLTEGENAVIKDAKGFLWVGALRGPLRRFDGKRFTTYFPNPNLPGDSVYSGVINFVEDSLKNIWVGTNDGLSRYDIQADSFTNFPTPKDSVNTDKSNTPFWCSRNAVYSLEAGARIVTYDIRSLQKKILVTLKPEERNIIGYAQFSILDTTSNAVWMLEWNPNSDFAKEGLIEISLRDGKSYHYICPFLRNIPGHGHFSEAMRFDSKRNLIWINSFDGLLTFSLATHRFQLADGFAELIKLKSYGRFVGLDLDREGRVWLSTEPKGILIYDPESKHITPVFTDSVLQDKLGYANYQVYCDPDGIVWTTYWDNRGIYELLPYNPSLIMYPAKENIKGFLSGPVWTIVPAPKGQIWLGTTSGLNLLDEQSGKFEVFVAKNIPVFKDDFILPIGIDTIRGILWLAPGSNDKVFAMDIATRKMEQIKFRDGLKQIDSINIEAPVVKGYQNGILVYDQLHGLFEIKSGSNFADLVIPFKGFVGRLELIADHLIVMKNRDLPTNYAFELIGGKWTRKISQIDSLDWWFTYYDKANRMFWVNSNNRFMQFDEAFRKVRTFAAQEGDGKFVRCMLTDNDGNLWFANGDKQIGRLNTRTGIINTLSPVDGFQPQFFDWSTPGTKNNKGEIYFGTSGLVTENKGLYRIYPDKFVTSKSSIINFVKLSVNSKSFPIAVGINALQQLSLRHDQNSITLETSIIDYYSDGKNQIRYKLESEVKNEDWQFGPAIYTIRYDGLTPGAYRLVLQSSNSSGEFNGPEKILFIKISPPWWQTWWARILFVLAFIIALRSYVQYRSRNLKLRNLQLEEKVIHRTKELKLSLEELREAQTQLIQREKMASLGELTAGIAHEIQNPLNFVNNFSEVNVELLDELKEGPFQHLPEADKKEASDILDGITQNLEKTIHHGKRADAIVKGMLQHSRSSTGIKVPADLNALADEYLRLSYHGLRAKDKGFNAIMKTEFDESIGKINIIPQDVGRVLLNLFNNSFYSVNEKHKLILERGTLINTQKAVYEPTVSVITKKLADKVEIIVRDNGLGIPEDKLNKIFQPFFTTKPTGEGTGLGLSLSYDIISKVHGGTLEVNTKEGEYAEFIIRLPL